MVPDSPRFPADVLRAFVERVFERVGIPADDAHVAADVLVEAELRGFDCHGLARLYPYFLRITRGGVETRPEIRIEWRTSATGHCDGGNGLGMVVAHRAMRAVIAKAAETGAAFLAVSRSDHFGIAGYYTSMAAQADMVGIALTSASPRVVPTGATAGVFGTNPISVAAPGRGEPSFLLDMATSAASSGKIDVALRKGERVPAGWLYPTARAFLDGEGVAPMSVLQYPLGGPKETGGYKGYGLAMMVDVLSGVLSGANTGRRLGAAKVPEQAANIGHFLGALRVAGFRELGAFLDGMSALVRDVKSVPREDGVEEVLVPGEPEAAARTRNLRDGIAVLPAVMEKMRVMADATGVALPA